jgi:hypothetical protein
MKPASAIAMLPAYDLLGLYGSFSWPRRLPTMSAIPSPAHKLQIRAIAIGEVLQNIEVAKVIVVA